MQSHVGSPNNLGDAGAPPLDRGVADPVKYTLPTRITLSYLIVLGQTVRA